MLAIYGAGFVAVVAEVVVGVVVLVVVVRGVLTPLNTETETTTTTTMLLLFSQELECEIRAVPSMPAAAGVPVVRGTGGTCAPSVVVVALLRLHLLLRELLREILLAFPRC